MINPMILNTLRSNYALEIESIEFLRDGGGTTYIVFCKNKKYLLKITNKTFMDTIKQSVDIIQYLETNDFPVPKIINTTDEQPFLTINDGDTQSMFILYEYINGEEPDIDEKAEDIGDLIGRFHLIMQGYTGEKIVRDKTYFIDRYISFIKAKGYSESKTAKYVELGNHLWECVMDLPYGYCHGDLHRGNLLITPDNIIYILDFDTSCYAPRMFDIMVMCDTTNYFEFSPKDFDYSTSIFYRFLKGYSKCISLSDAELKSFYNFIAIRHYQLQATILEIYGMDCIDELFIDKQFNWLMNWRKRCDKEGVK